MRKKLYITGTVVLVCILVIFFCDRTVDTAARNKLYTNTDSIPFNKVGLLLGTSKHLANGRINPYYANRISAALELWRAGKIRYLIISGDNSRKDYNEPALMRGDLVEAGMDSSLLFLDYAGFRTFDSMVRLREIFGQSSVTVISQRFHNERAVFIASREHIDAVGFNARDVGKRFGTQVRARELLARVKLFLDYMFGKEPKFLGERILIP